MSNHEPRHVITPSGHPKETLEWLEWRGYRAAVVQPVIQEVMFPGIPATGAEMIGKAGVVFGRKNHPLVLAQVGDVLVWDGSHVTIEE